MVGDRLINAKELLIQHNELMSKKMQEIKKIKSFDEYSVWVKENKQTLSELFELNTTIFFELNTTIFYLFDHDIAQFTVDEDTYELAKSFIENKISQIQNVLDENTNPLNPNPLFANENNSPRVLIQLNSDMKLLEETKEKYKGYLISLEDNLPKC